VKLYSNVFITHVRFDLVPADTHLSNSYRICNLQAKRGLMTASKISSPMTARTVTSTVRLSFITTSNSAVTSR
jgi:hypothetical protein